MGHKHCGLQLRLALEDAEELEVHLLAGQFVEGAERFVEKQHGRALDEGPCQRYPLLHPPGELPRPVIIEPGKAHEGQQLPGPVDVGGPHMPMELHWQQDVVDRGPPG